MNALVLCAGFGRRLGSLCQERPKPMLSLGPCTILEHILMRLREAEISRVYINLHYRARDIVEHIGNGARFGLQVEYSHESSPLGTAGTIAQLAGRLGSVPLLVHYGDIVTSQSLQLLTSAHAHWKNDASILVHKRPGSNSFAYFGQEHRIEQFIERPAQPPENAERSHAFSGICVLSPKCVRDISAHNAKDLPADVFPDLARRAQLRGLPLTGFRVAVDSPQRLEQARQALAKGLLSS